MNNKLSMLSVSVLVAVAATNADAQLWEKTFDGSTTNGVTGTIILDDWGFIGPQGRQADSFAPYGGVFGTGLYETNGKAFCIADPAACGVGQRQHVVVTGPDGITPDAPATILDDFLPDTGDFINANVDSLTTFFQWGYTTVGGSTFNDMMIDYDGDYKIAKDDMTFEFFDTMDYTQVIPDGGVRLGTNPDTDPDAVPPIIYHNTLNFQPYAVSDAEGWCGSVIAAHPNAHEAMAGQVKFDIIMDVYQRKIDTEGNIVLQFFSSELTSDFEMRSFGNIVVDFPDNAQYMAAQAVVNNTDANVAPQSVSIDTPTGDLSWHNRVSFMGADVLKTGYWCGIQTAEWQGGARGIGVKHYETIRYDITTLADCEAIPDAKWAKNAFPGFAYILRADADRVIDYFDEEVYGPDPMTIDTDADGVLDFMDNCTLAANPGQQDTDGDNYGNACDADLNNDNIVNSLDIGLFINELSLYFSTPGVDIDSDFNSDGYVDLTDMAIFKSLFFQPPGPSGTAQ